MIHIILFELLEDCKASAREANDLVKEQRRVHHMAVLLENKVLEFMGSILSRKITCFDFESLQKRI